MQAGALPPPPPGWLDQRLVRAMQDCTADTGQHHQWWQGMNNGMSKSWLMQDGHNPEHTRYSEVDAAPWAFVYECKESSLPAAAMDVAYLFSGHAMVNMRGAMVPTKMLVPRIDTTLGGGGNDRGGRPWRIVGVLKKKKQGGAADGRLRQSMVDDEAQDSDDDDDDEADLQRRKAAEEEEWKKKVIHDLDLEDQGIPSLGGDIESADLENISPVRIEAWMTKVQHYASGAGGAGGHDDRVQCKLFCIMTVTPVRNLILGEYLRTTVVENLQGNLFPGMTQIQSESMRKNKKDMLHRILLEQMEFCGFFSQKMDRVPDPLDALNMQGSDYYPGTYLCVPMAYKRIQNMLKRQGIDSHRIYVEGFSDNLLMVTGNDLLQAKLYNSRRALSFYAAVNEYEALKADERGGYTAKLADENPPSWPAAGAGGGAAFPPSLRRASPGPDPSVVDGDDDNEDLPQSGGESDDELDRQLDSLYTQNHRMPPIKICLLYNPLMYMSPSLTRSEWEQQLGGFPAFFIYTMSRSIYSSASNPLLKPEYFMPEAKKMSMHDRWVENTDDGQNPLAGYYVAGWAHKQFTRVIEACRQTTQVGFRAKLQMLRDYMQTCYNMHLGLIDTGSLRSKTVYWAHRLMKNVNDTAGGSLEALFRDDMKIGSLDFMGRRCTHPHCKTLADGGYAQVSFLHCEAMAILNRDFFHLNDLNLSLLWRMLVTTVQHNIGMHNRLLSSMGSSMLACRGGGHYTGRFMPAGPLAGGAGSRQQSGIADTYQALDKPNSVGGDYVVSHHAWMKSLNVINSQLVRQFDNGQVPEDMTRFTEAGLRMIATVLVDDKNAVRSEPLDNLLSEFYLTEMQITNIELLKTLVGFFPRNMKTAPRGFSVDISTIDANKTGERTTTRRLPVPGYSPHVVIIMTNMRAQQPEIKERLETAAIVMQRCFCGGQVDLSSGSFSCLADLRKSGFAQYTWNSEKALGSFPKDSKNIAALFCTSYAAAAYYVMMCNKHAMFPMELSPLCSGLCRWIESIFSQYLSTIYGRRQNRDMSRTLEIYKATACSECAINYTTLMMLRCPTLSEAIPHIMMCSFMDPIHIFEMPRLCYNVILNSVSLPVFFAISIFQREMEIPTLPLESVVDFFTNGKVFGCCAKSGVQDWRQSATGCHLGAQDCHTRRVREMLIRMLNRRALLPKYSGVSLNFMSNCTPYLTAYGDQGDRCDMSSHKVFGRSRPTTTSCMRGQLRQPRQQRGGSAAAGAAASAAAAGGDTEEDQQQQQQAASSGGGSGNEAADACRFFARQCFQLYSAPLVECAMITEGEFLQSMEEFMLGMSTKFVQFFGDVPFFAQHETVCKNLGIQETPACFQNISHKNALEQGMPIIQARTFASGEIAIGIDWMCMLLMLAISGSARLDQQVGKNVAANLTASLFNKIPFSMYPYDSIQIREFNPHMPCQEILLLKEAHERPACIMRPNNKGILDDSIPLQERMLLPTSPLCPELMLEDFAWSSPYHNLCQHLGITTSVYDLPIDLVQWTPPYPTGVLCPVIRYGAQEEEEEGQQQQQRPRGYIKVYANGSSSATKKYKAKLCIYGKEDIMLAHVQDAALLHSFGPRPLLCTPCRGVRISDSEIGVLVPVSDDTHPASRYYSAKDDLYRVYSPVLDEEMDVEYDSVLENVLPMGSSVLIKAWADCVRKLVPHIVSCPAAAAAAGRAQQQQQVRAALQEGRMHIMAKIVTPREAAVRVVDRGGGAGGGGGGDAEEEGSSSSRGVWVCIEVKHTFGYLKDTSFADMVTIKVPVKDLVPMPSDPSMVVFYKEDSLKKKKRKTDSAAAAAAAQAEGHQLAGAGAAAEVLTVCRFVYATPVVDRR